MRKECENSNVNSENKKWLILLSNLCLNRGDTSTVQILALASSSITSEEINEMIEMYKAMYPDYQKTQNDNRGDSAVLFPSKITWNKISFCWNSRNWELVDDKFGELKKIEHKINTPVLSGSLITAFKETDKKKSIIEMATEISHLLSFALGRDIQPCSFRLLADDKPLYIHDIAYAICAFNDKCSNIIDNWTHHNIKRFVESSEKPFRENKEWWIRTLGLFVSGTSEKLMLETRLSTLFVLLERLSTFLVKNKGNYIHTSVPDRVEDADFRERFHDVLITHIPNWDNTRTQSLIDTIVKFNAEPSFPNKISMACEALKIPSMTKSRIHFRHKLLHEGDFDKKLKNGKAVFEYYMELEAMAVLLISVSLGFDGYLHLWHHNNFEPVLISDVLLSGTDDTNPSHESITTPSH